MSKDFSTPQRQEILGVLLLYAKNLRRFINLFLVAVVGTRYTEFIPLEPWTIIYIVAGLLVIFTVFQYLRFKFHVAEEEFVIKKGVFRREEVRIPFDRIQTVQLSQGVIQQLLGLTGLKVDTAGSGGQEIGITALKMKDARRLEEVLSSAKTKAAPQTETVEVDEKVEDESYDSLVKLTIGKLMVVGLTQNHIRSGFAAIGLVMAYWWQLSEMFGQDYSEQIESQASRFNEEVFSNVDPLLIAIQSVIFFVLLSLAVSVGRTILRHFNLHAKLGKSRILLTAGLLKRVEQSIPISKVQWLVYEDNFLRRIPGFKSLVIKQSKSGDQERKLNVEIPAMYPDDCSLMDRSVFGMPEGEVKEYRPHWYYRFYLSAWYFILGSAIIGIAYLNFMSMYVLIAFPLLLLIVFFYSARYHERIILNTDGDTLEYRKGWLFSKRSVTKSHKLQSLKIRQSIFQKRRGTAHLVLYTAGGTVVMRFMPESFVKELYDYLLYRIETSTKPWM